MFFFKDPITFLFGLPALLVAITAHEYAHGKMAYLLGDPTPKATGRLSFNPLKHLDIFGTIMLLVVGFGWAKPVQINPLYFKERKKGIILTALAGPGMNMVLAYFSGLFFVISTNAGINYLPYFFYYSLWYNCVLAVFNLVPIPPLDGSKVLYGFVPGKHLPKLYFLQRYGNIILIIALISGVLSRIISPVIYGLITGIDFLVRIVV